MPCRRITNVLGRVDISVRLVPAGNAGESRLVLSRLGCAVPAGVAGLRRETRVDLLCPARSLLLQPGHELAPSVGEDAPVQARFLTDVPPGRFDGAARRPGHVADLQVLDGD